MLVVVPVNVAFSLSPVEDEADEDSSLHAVTLALEVAVAPLICI